MVIEINQILSQMELEAKARIGQQDFSFYFPVSIGTFVIQLWTECSAVSQPKSSPKSFSAQLYENGQIVKPSRDKRMKGFSWARNGVSIKSEEIAQFFSDLLRLSCS